MSWLQIHAQTCCSGGVPMSGNLGLPIANTHTWQFAVSYDVNVLKTLKTGTETLNERNRQRITQSLMLQTGYSISERFSTDIFVPLIRQERRISNPGLTDDIQQTNGIGDMVLLLKYNLIYKGPINWTIGVGPKFPTGATDFKRNGILLGADLQPGSGAWDGIAWSYLIHQIKSRKSMSVTLIANYRYTGTNENFRLDQSYRFGRDFQLIAGIADRLVVGKTIVDPSISFRYRNAGEDEAGGNEIPNTGGEWVFINPMVSVAIGSKLSANFGFELPLYANISGTQLTPTYRINAGLHYILNSDTDILNLKPQ